MVKLLIINLPPKYKDIFKSKRYKIFYGGRSSGKSWSVAIYLLLMAMKKETLILCAREFQSSIKDSSKALIEQQIKRLKLEYFFKVTRNEIIGLNQSKFIFKGLAINTQNIT